MQTIIQEGQSQQWIVLAIFFTVFALAGLFNKPRSRQLEYFHFIGYGMLIIAINVVMLILLTTNTSGGPGLVNAVLLQETSIESSFIVFGYCMISRGLGQYLRGIFIADSYSSRSNFRKL